MNVMDIAMDLEVIREYLEKTEADPDAMAAYEHVRDQITRTIGFLMNLRASLKAEEEK